VQEQARKFVYPDLDTVSPAVQPAGGGGGELSVTVASSEASDLEKEKADYVCTGVNDGQVIMAAKDASLAGTNGRLKLSSGTFYVDDGELEFANDIWVQGTGFLSTTIRLNDGNHNGVIVRAHGTSEFQFSDMSLYAPNSSDTIGIHCDNNSDSLISNLWLQTLTYGIFVESNFTRIEGLRCNAASVNFPVRGGTAGYRDLLLANCHYLIGIVHLENMVSVTIDNCQGYFGIYGEDARGWRVTNNTF
jgi:hypothetical protein